MTHVSDPAFRTTHALRIKGFAKVDTVAEIADLPVDDVQQHLHALLAAELAVFREARALWQLTPAGRQHHAAELAADVAAVCDTPKLSTGYGDFLKLNDEFKDLCGEWQLRSGAPNDHSDAAYDSAVIGKLVGLHGLARPVVEELAIALYRLTPYAPRLASTCQRVVAGETNMFTGVMCGSYHDVWMELHEDLILSQGIDRAAEGSF